MTEINRIWSLLTSKDPEFQILGILCMEPSYNSQAPEHVKKWMIEESLYDLATESFELGKESGKEIMKKFQDKI